jgi:ubiquinone/menaquinone biosynthesis C-methylase UbiE
MPDFHDATPITMQAYAHIAHDYTQRHTQAVGISSFWHDCLQSFSAFVLANPAYQRNPALPVVDIGCGPGRDSLWLAHYGFEVLATDLSDAMLAEARERCLGQPEAEHITFRRMDMRSLELADAACAGLWSSASFLHIPKQENMHVLREFMRVLVPGGALMVIAKESDGGADERYDAHVPSGQVRFFARYHGAELWALLEQAGFTVQEMGTTIDTRFENPPRWLGALATKTEASRGVGLPRPPR